MPARQRAFTLIELLVTISILSLLVALLLSAIGLVRTAALKSLCGSNQRQVAIAAMAYAEEWDGLLTADRKVGSENATTSPVWFHRLPAYLDLPNTGIDRTVFHCPVWRMPTTAVQPLVANYPRSFKQNDYLDFDPARREYQYNQATPTNRHYRLGSAPDQTELLLIADGDLGGDGTTGYGQWGRLQESLVDLDRHRGRAVGIALDCHLVSAGKADEFHWVSDGWPAP